MQQNKFEPTYSCIVNMFVSAAFFFVSFVFAIIGYINITKTNNIDEVVGGDAYNYIIHFAQYNGFLLVSVVLALFGILTALYAIYLMLSEFARFYGKLAIHSEDVAGDKTDED